MRPYFFNVFWKGRLHVLERVEQLETIRWFWEVDHGWLSDYQRRKSNYRARATWLEEIAATLAKPSERAFLRLLADDYRNSKPHGNSKRQQYLKGPGITGDQWLALKSAYDHRCAYCGQGGDLTKDHYAPVSRGGRHELTNIVPACFSCNLKKSANPAPSDAPLRLMF